MINQITTENKRQVRIEIPVQNVVTIDFLKTIFPEMFLNKTFDVSQYIKDVC